MSITLREIEKIHKAAFNIVSRMNTIKRFVRRDNDDVEEALLDSNADVDIIKEILEKYV